MNGMALSPCCGGGDYAPNERRNAVIQRARHGVSTHCQCFDMDRPGSEGAIVLPPILLQLAGLVTLASVTTECPVRQRGQRSEVTTRLIARWCISARDSTGYW